MIKTSKYYMSYEEYRESSVGQMVLRDFRQLFPESKKTDDEVIRPSYEQYVAYKERVLHMSCDELQRREDLYGFRGLDFD